MTPGACGAPPRGGAGPADLPSPGAEAGGAERTESKTSDDSSAEDTLRLRFEAQERRRRELGVRGSTFLAPSYFP